MTLRAGQDYLLPEDLSGRRVPMRIPLDDLEAISSLPCGSTAAGRSGRDLWRVVLRFENGRDFLLEDQLKADEALALGQSVSKLVEVSLDRSSERMFGLPTTRGFRRRLRRHG